MLWRCRPAGRRLGGPFRLHPRTGISDLPVLIDELTGLGIEDGEHKTENADDQDEDNPPPHHASEKSYPAAYVPVSSFCICRSKSLASELAPNRNSPGVSHGFVSPATPDIVSFTITR